MHRPAPRIGSFSLSSSLRPQQSLRAHLHSTTRNTFKFPLLTSPHSSSRLNTALPSSRVRSSLVRSAGAIRQMAASTSAPTSASAAATEMAPPSVTGEQLEALDRYSACDVCFLFFSFFFLLSLLERAGKSLSLVMDSEGWGTLGKMAKREYGEEGIWLIL